MNLSCFLASNALKPEPGRFVVSKRFRGADGEPEPFVLTPLSAEEDDAIRRDCYVLRGGEPVFDEEKYLGQLAAACVESPSLCNAELQDSYGCRSAESLLREMLLAGEYAALLAECQRICGFDMADDVSAVKKN